MAVYTEVSDTALAGFLADYDLGQLLAYKGIAEGVENSNFLLHVAAGFFILTLYEKRVRASDLPFFLGLMEHLAEGGVHCPLPVKNRDGQALVHLNRRNATIVTFLTGIALRRPDAAHCASAARVMAGLHKAGEGFALARANALGPQGWRPLAEAIHGADTIEDGLGALISSSLDELVPAWPSDLPAGVIHADYFPDNVLFVGNEVGGVIDFYFACNDFYVYDLAIMLNSWCFELDGSYNITKGQSVINAYRQQRELSDAEIDALPILMRGAALRFLLTRTYDWLNPDPNALVRPKDPREYSKKLRFHNKVRHAREYGL
jgi:homoserine kinase type II